MVFAMCASFVPVGEIVAASTGDLITAPSTDAVYYVAEDGSVIPFPNDKCYFTWYEDFDAVITVSDEELSAMTLSSKLINYRPGTRLIKIPDFNKVYAIEPGGVLRHVADEATALALYGADWSSLIDDVSSGFFNSYNSDTALDNPVTVDSVSEGYLFNYADDTIIYYVNAAGEKRMVTEAGFTANMFNADYVLTGIADTVTFTTGTSVTETETGLFQIVPDTTPVAPTPVGGDLSVALAAGTPAAGTIPNNSSNVFVKFDLMAGSADASITSIKLTVPVGTLGTYTYIDEVAFFNAAGTKLGTSKNITSDGVATFNFSTPIVVSAGTTKTLSVKATIESSQTGLFALGIASADDITVDGGSVTGNFPIDGNVMEAITATIGTITMSSVETSDTTPNFGEQNVKLAGMDFAAANENIIWETARFKNGGTNDSDIVNNLRLLVDGDEVAEGVIDGRYITFNLNNLLIEKNDTITVDVYGDVGIGSVGNTIDLYIADKSDFSFMGQQYGYGVQIASITSLDAASEGAVATLAAGDFTIAMDKSATPSKDVMAGTQDVVLATITMVSNGENSTVNYITDSATTGDFYVYGSGLTTGEADAFELVDTDTGAIYDITETVSTSISAVSAGGWTLSITEDIPMTLGETKTFELRCDLGAPTDTYPIDDTDTLKVVLEDGAFSITGDDSNANITNITPASISSAITTVRAATLAWTTINLTNLTAVGGAGSEDPVVVYKALLEVGESSDVSLTSVELDADATYYSAFTDDNIAQLDLYIVEGETSRELKSTAGDIASDGLAAGSITFNSLNTTNRVLTAGVDVYLEARAVFASTVTAGTFALEVDNATTSVVAKDSDNTAVAESVTSITQDSRLVTLATKGTLKVEMKVTDQLSDEDTYTLAGATTGHGRYLGELVFTTTNEAIEITDLALQEYKTATGNDLAYVHLFDEDGNLVATKTTAAAGHVHFEKDDFVGDAEILSADQATSYFIGVTTKSINAEGDDFGTASYDRGIEFSLATSTALAAFSDLSTDEAVKAKGVDSGEDITIIEDTNGTLAAGEYSLGSVKSKTASTTGSILTTIVNSMSDGTLSGGNGKVVGKYTFTFDNGNNRVTSTNEALKAQLESIIVNVATSSGVLATNFYVYIEGDSANKTNADQPDANSEVTATLTEIGTDQSLVDGEVTLVVIADLSVTGSDQYIQTELDTLATDFTYNGNHNSWGTNWVNARLDGISDVQGGTLSN